MQGEIVSTRVDSHSDLKPSEKLGDRLDSVIGEASSGMGALLSELLRRSLKAGVTDIGELLAGHAQEQVESAVARQMPEITEAADAVADSTSRRVVRKAVDEITQKSEEQRKQIESKIEAVEQKAVDQEAIEELRGKARQSWRKLKDELGSLQQTQQQLAEENATLRRLLDEAQQEQQQQQATLLSQCQELAGRLAELEKPKGLRALFSKFRRSDSEKS